MFSGGYNLKAVSHIGKILCFGGDERVKLALLFALAPLAAVGQGHVLQRLADPLVGADSGYHALAEITGRKSVPL